jgi:phosphatidyl-myo-inositol dimannoside synthase
MRLLYLVSDFNLTGGKERYNRAWFEVLENAPGVEPKVVTLKKNTIPAKLAFVLRAIWNAGIYKPDFILSAHIHFTPLCLALKKALRIPYIVMAYGVEAWNIKNAMIAHAVEKAHTVISISEYTKKKLISQIPTIQSRIVIIPPFVTDETRFTIKEKPKHLIEKHGTKGVKVILSVSRLYRTESPKGIERVIKALPLIKKEVPHIKYIVIGKGSKNKKLGDDRERLQKLASKLGVTNNLVLAGHIPDEELPHYYNLCDLFILPSKKEGFGIVFLEALACGKPVIAGNRDGSGEPLLNGEVGTLVNPDSVEEITNATIKVLSGNAPNQLTDERRLRNKTLESYGFATFRGKVLNIINELEQKKKWAS